MNADMLGYLKIAAGVAIVSALGATVAVVNGMQPKLDENFCPIDIPIPGEIILVTDMSEPEDAAAVPDLIREYAARLPRHHRLSVYRIAGAKADEDEAAGWPLSKVLVRCNPGRADEVNPLVVGVRVAEARFREHFEGPLDEAIGKLVSKAGASQSPIIEAVGHIGMLLGSTDPIGSIGPADASGSADSTHPTGSAEAAGSRTLVIRSDFLQHTASFSQYRKAASVDKALEQTGTTLPDLDEVEIDLRYVSRQKYREFQTPAHREFWADLMARSGAEPRWIEDGARN